MPDEGRSRMVDDEMGAEWLEVKGTVVIED
jgi:hypothetical protein